jgi:hypothetical protein
MKPVGHKVAATAKRATSLLLNHHLSRAEATGINDLRTLAPKQAAEFLGLISDMAEKRRQAGARPRPRRLPLPSRKAK